MMIARLAVGFTGTRVGMTPEQLRALRMAWRSIAPVGELHHGDCDGSDDQAHNAFDVPGKLIIVHPPDIDARRAGCVSKYAMQVNRPVLDYHARNMRIVAETEGLFAAPKEETGNPVAGGTWTTIGHALNAGRPVWIIRPSGKTEFIMARNREVKFDRTDNLECKLCGVLYGQHPYDLRSIASNATPYLNRLCDGRVVKL